MDCKHFVNLIPEVLLLDPEDQTIEETVMEEFDQHFEECENCRKIFDFIGLIDSTLISQSDMIFGGKDDFGLDDNRMKILHPLRQVSLTLRKNKEFNKAIPILEFLIGIGDKPLANYLFLALGYTNIGDFDKALSTLRKADLQDVTEFDVLIRFAQAFSDCGGHEESRKLYEKCYELDPENKYVMCNLGSAYTECREFEAAEALLSKTIDLYPSDPDIYTVYHNLAVLYYETERMELAIEMIDKSYEISPEHPDIIRTREIIHNRAKGKPVILYLT
ncbi:hypothetical protein D1BOALGB6SA_1038 [Olavius sp. associated proteobacterium Delta 1]|nr:hypothetical protein D1BOALGB6SA_1038 [Olavius sp. associated proteobacterium Delta 1]